MAVVINGDTGITSVNGTAGAPSITGTDTDTGVVYGTNTVSISTGGTERVRVDSSGNVGVGVTPSAWATVVPAIELKNGVHFASLGTSAPIGYLGANTYYNGTNWIYKNSSQYATRYETNSNGAGAHAWFTAPNSGGSGAGTTATFTQAMTLNANGALVLQGGNTSASGVGIAFPATQSASTDANTLDDYEEGTWTPSQGAGLTVVGSFSSAGTYTKIGNTVYITFRVSGSTSVAAAAAAIVTNLPFPVLGTSPGQSMCGGLSNAIASVTSICNPSGSNLFSVGQSFSASANIYGSAVYQTA